MKKRLHVLCMCLVTLFVMAQEQSENHPFLGNGTVDYSSTDKGLHMQMQVGGVLPPNSYSGDVNLYFGFPYGILYKLSTFYEAGFEVSKGYYGDRVQLDWSIGENIGDIENILIYRRPYTATVSAEYFQLDNDGTTIVHESFGKPIVTLSNDVYTYSDAAIEGGLLYEYLVYAKGVSVIADRYTNYITGIGYRNPTAIVTGNVSFSGDSPVKDVIVRAEPQGDDISVRSSILVSDEGRLEVQYLNKEITTKVTFQSWLRMPETANFTWLKLQETLPATGSASNDYVYTKIALIDDGEEKALTFTVGHTNDDDKLYKVTLKKFYPTGDVDGKGDDILNPISEISQNFIHLSIVLNENESPKLYLNGRLLRDEYIDEIIAVEKEKNNEDERQIPELITVSNYMYPANATFNSIAIADKLNGIIDEVRLWQDVLSTDEIRQDFKRYLSGTESNLLMYLRIDEQNGSYAYDLSAKGFDFNKNKAFLYKSAWTSSSDDRPTSNQLGIVGVTDENGNYIIASIPYAGTGESYNITPSFGVHQFSPSQASIFLGDGAKVVNQVDFEDVSSFIFKGTARIDLVGTFDPIKNNDGSINVPGVLQVNETGYNEYTVIDTNGSSKAYQKGDYQAGNIINTIVDMPNIGVEGANVYIDGELVLDDESLPITTDENGNFEIEVPIGNHYIEVKKENHNFTYGGRFPMLIQDALAQEERVSGSALTDEEIAFITEKHKINFEFFEHQESSVTFLDQTKVTLVGKVVGGSVEGAKPIGFGGDGVYYYPFDSGTTDEEKVAISAVNNIGIATIKLSHEGGDVILTTNEDSGEYRRELAPLQYVIEKTSTSYGVTIVNDEDNISDNFLSANESLNLSEVPLAITTTFSVRNEIDLESVPYHFEKSFIYRSSPQLFVTRQTSEEKIEIEDEVFEAKDATLNGEELAIYKQAQSYYIDLETYELYSNYDTKDEVTVAKVPVLDGEFIINNNLALEDSESIMYDEDDKSKSIYTFRGGIPGIIAPFLKTLSINYRVNGIDTEAIGYSPRGLILGGKSDGSQTFVTAAPDVPAIILRDPPGTNSFASIEAGTSVSFTTESSFTNSAANSAGLTVSLGTDFKIGGGLLGPVIATDFTNDAETGVSLEIASTDGVSLTKTYTFNQAIYTSAEPDYVGADGDLYIGNSKNYFYGSYDNIQINRNNFDEDNSVGIELLKLNSSGEKVLLFISKVKAFRFVEEASSTFFIYSQKHILETLIPELELIISNINNGVLTANEEGVLSLRHYEQQIELWRESILKNEYAKYESNENPEGFLAGLKLSIAKDKAEIETQIKIDELGGYDTDSDLTDALNDLEVLEEELLNRFSENISLDAGVGEFTKSFETASVSSRASEYSFSADEEFTGVNGFELNGVGTSKFFTVAFNESSVRSAGVEEESTSVISYTLMDNDDSNILSINVINAFDGNGPIFTTIGGRTSCPYEDDSNAHFLNENTYKNVYKPYYNALDAYNTYLIKKGEYKQCKIESLSCSLSEPELVEAPSLPIIEEFGEEDEGLTLNYATQKVEDPVISAEVTNIINVPEDGKAEFTLVLENNGVGTSEDTDFNLKVDTASNPYNVILNIADDGNIINIPKGERVYYTLTMEKSLEDQFKYEGIVFVLESLCDGDNPSDSIELSATFVPSCSNVTVSAPFNGWLVNNENIYNDDGTVNALKVELSEFRPDYSTFKKIDLEYRKTTSSSWNRLHTYYKAPFTSSEGEEIDYLAIAEENGEDKNSLIEDITISYDLDIAGLNLADSEYEIRAISYCIDGTEYVSDVISGTIDLTKPQQFGTPSPADGILSAGDDLRLQFSEPINYNSAISKIEIVAETNQMPINHSVSVAFNGAGNNMTIEKTNVFTGDYSIEFWMHNKTTGDAIIMEQENGFSLMLAGGELVWTLGGETIKGVILQDDLFHHYTLTYDEGDGELRIYEDSTELKVVSVEEMNFTNSNTLTLGGSSFIGNIHDLRMWTKSISLAESVTSLYEQYTGSERDLVGYWKMNEGRGAIANDLARFIHAVVNTGWDISPKTTSYEFNGNEYLELDLNDFSTYGGVKQIDDEMDVTLSFWVKTSSNTAAGLISNGRGTEDDMEQYNGKRNKWSVEIDESGKLVFNNEGFSYELTNTSITDDLWHHVAIVVRRSGALNTYVDNGLVSSHSVTNIGGLSGSKFWIGARGHINETGEETVDRNFTGKLEEIRLWNTARSLVQIERDSYTEIPPTTLGLVIYASMNSPEVVNAKGPAYFHALSDGTMISANTRLSSGVPNYSEDSPSLQPARELLSFDVSSVINGDEIIITPEVSDWAILENQTLDITVDYLFDDAENRQASPVTWTAYVSKNNIEWYAGDNKDLVEIEKVSGDSYEFEITVLNKGNVEEKFEIINIPDWLTLSESLGTLDPSNGVIITATVDKELSIGEYVEDLYLETDFGLDERLQLSLRVLNEAPDWSVSEPDYSKSMNIVGAIKINEQFSRDVYTKVGAFVNDEPRGEAYLTYDENYDSYFVYLSIYSNVSSGESVSFKIWDALNGKVLTSSINAQLNMPFLQNDVLGSKSNSIIFSAGSFSEQTISLNEGWTWFSPYVEDNNFTSIKTTFNGLTLESGDQIKSQNLFTQYENGDWYGSLLAIEAKSMYKIKLLNQNKLTIEGQDVDETDINLTINEGWNWLPFPIHKSTKLEEAFSLYNPTDGDVIKDQFNFAIYDEFSGWSGSLSYLTPNNGYMLKAGIAQVFNYPNSGTVAKYVTSFKGAYKENNVSFFKYNENMNIIAELAIDGDYTDVLVYDEKGMLRGTSPIVDIHGKKLSFITVYSDKEETLKFMTSINGELVDLHYSFVFENNKVMGDINNPVVLGLKTLSSEEMSLGEVLLQPNPFTDNIIVDTVLRSDEFIKIDIYSIIGNQIYQEVTSERKTIIDTSDFARGVYLIKLTTSSGKKIIKKIVKK